MCKTLDFDWKQLLLNMSVPIIYDGRRVLDQPSLSKIGWEVHAVRRSSSYNAGLGLQCAAMARTLKQRRISFLAMLITTKIIVLDIEKGGAFHSEVLV